eukprot:CAMPEP_0202894116 /NCGR_PEP_ID=MMETSP1392-20130828/3564_1 /ASSEMBLY_ACC=CAM_ASM_000868 /TAXON_ID=225041 /ORGANISM="Chlamydomonas chlamydogama, Strain SAG 11-48b" /LENGTH=381 /DNA_ID=CAMNT_0049578689 /DNA_START=87 /DNA_END=1229 /DNA_ORIENTATION=-
MEDQIKLLLSQMYASAPQEAPAPPKIEANPRSNSDDFRMYCYKVLPCSRRGGHDWTECCFAHPGEKATRRCPQKYSYFAIACPDMKKNGDCPRGERCMFAHNVFEYWLHPSRYRTQLCSYGAECKRSMCFFAHHLGELRVTEDQAQLAALERELEGGDSGPGFHSDRKWANNPQHQAQQAKTIQMLQMQQQQQQQQRQVAATAALLGSDNVQFAKLRQLQHAMSAQGSNMGPQQQALFNAALHNLAMTQPLQPPQQPNQPMPPVHASASAAAAALLEAALQPATPPLAHPVAMSPGLSPVSSLLSPVPSINNQQDDMMRLLADLSAAKSSLGPGGMGLQPTHSLPLLMPQAAQQAAAAANMQQAMQLISHLHEMTAKQAVP